MSTQYAVNQETLTIDVEHIINQSDLRKITQRSVFQRLQNKYGILLTHFKPFIYEQAVETARKRIQSSPDLQKQQKMIHPKQQNKVINYKDVKNYYTKSRSYCLSWTSSASSSESSDSSSSSSSSECDEPPQKKRKYNDSKTRRDAREAQKDRVCEFSESLKALMGKDSGTWRECWQWVTDYANANDLRVGTRKIRCDAVLKKLFARDISSVSGISRLIWKHLIGHKAKEMEATPKPKEKKSPPKVTPKRRYRKRQRDENGEIIKKRKKSGLTRMCFMSAELQAIVGDSRPLARNKITKGFWDYLEKNSLKRPGRLIVCDEKLKKIWGDEIDSVHMYSVQKGLKKHITTMSKEQESEYKLQNPHLFENDK